MFRDGDNVVVNEKGRVVVQHVISDGLCKDTLPEVLEGRVTGVDDYIRVRLPLGYPGMFGNMKYDWPFLPHELNPVSE